MRESLDIRKLHFQQVDALLTAVARSAHGCKCETKVEGEVCEINVIKSIVFEEYHISKIAQSLTMKVEQWTYSDEVQRASAGFEVKGCDASSVEKLVDIRT